MKIEQAKEIVIFSISNVLKKKIELKEKKSMVATHEYIKKKNKDKKDLAFFTVDLIFFSFLIIPLLLKRFKILFSS